MKSLSVSDRRSAPAKTSLASRFRPKIGHVLAMLVFASLLGWAALLLAIRLVLVAL